MKSQPKLRLSALALAAAVTLGLASPDALALALGRVTVQSALGEPLRADIDIPQINAEEVSSLKATIAAPSAYRAAGLEYSPALANVQITLQKRPDGSYFLRLASDRPVNEPFVDVILETNWSTGRVQRDFTMLFDPPALRQAAPGTPLPAQATAPSAPRSPAARTAPSTAERAAPATPSAAARPATAPAPAPSRAAAPAAPAGEGKRVTVQGGDTAGKLAAANKPASVSLDQMLVALLRANPDAFVDGNVNRLRAGAVLEMPSAEQASSVAPQEARQTLVAQSRDFNEFRRRLAEGVPAAAAPAAGRQASGRLQAQVEDKKAADATPDKLTLSKGAVQGKSTSADKIARERAAQDSATRIAELDKNIAELNRLSSSTPGTAGGTGTRPGAGIPTPPGVPAVAGAPAPTAATKPAAPEATVAKVAAAPAPVATPATPESKPATATAAAAPASSPAAATPATAEAAAATDATATAAALAASAATGAASAAPAGDAAPVAAPAKPVAAAKPAPKRAPPPPPEPSLVDDVLENPLIPALGVGLLAVLLGFGFYKVRQKRKTAAVDSSFLESRLQPDSFFGASGGQRVDTAETNNPTGSSMVYSPSQLDAAGDVDPVAEADVYLAYGRDLQAEEILKEALRINPQRVAIHAKLLEIYAKRRDAKAFETVAAEAYNLTRGTGHEWEHICELGRDLDASNPMYRPGGQPGGKAAGTAPPAPGIATAAPVAAASPIAAAAGDIDLDLDFSLGDEPATEAPAPVAVARPGAKPAAAPAPVVAAPAKTEPLAMDFSSAPSLDLPPVDTAPAKLDSGPAPLADNSLNFEPVAPAPKAAPAPAPVAAAPAAKGDMLEFDLGGLSLDLPGSAPAAAAPAPAVQAPSLSLDSAPAVGDLQLGGLDEADNPLATKLALAEEFNAIGDADGARSLAEEVLAEASGDLKSRAQRLLAEIG